MLQDSQANFPIVKLELNDNLGFNNNIPKQINGKWNTPGKIKTTFDYMTPQFTNAVILVFYRSNFHSAKRFFFIPFRELQLCNLHFDTHGVVFLQSTKPDIGILLLEIF